MASYGTFTLDRSALARLTSESGEIAKNLLPRVRQVESAAKRLAPVDTGRMRSSIHIDGPHSDAHGVFYDVVVATNYAIYVHEGTRYIAPRPFLLEALTAIR